MRTFARALPQNRLASLPPIFVAPDLHVAAGPTAGWAAAAAAQTTTRLSAPRTATSCLDNPSMSIYHEGNRRFQERFDTRRLADRIEERFFPRAEIDDSDRAFIEACDMLFIAT